MPTITTSEYIEAPPEKVWRVLTDLPSYSEWNPFIIEGSGKLEEGGKVNLTMRPPGGKPMAFRPIILRLDAGQELRWKGRVLVPGIFDGEHWFRLSPEGEGTRVDHGEKFTGLLPRFTGGMLKRTEAGFIQLNEALKQRSEGSPESAGQ